MSARPATELLPANTDGRVFRAERTVRLGDVDPSATLRLDGISRYLQDVATDDANDADFPGVFGWVVRRTMMRIDRPARLDEQLSLATFCTGAGRSWAERRTSISGRNGAAIEAVSLWVQIDTDTGRPARLGDEFAATWGSATGGRTVSSKLSLPAPGDLAATVPWTFRRTDLDPFRHVNNAAQWAVVEELLQERSWNRCGVGELEFAGPIDETAETELLVDGTSCWLAVDGRVTTAGRWTPDA